VVAVFSDISDMERISQEIKEINKHTKDSIEYASLIQHALIPEDNIFNNIYQDSFAIWTPKDIVGGDIYLFETINEDESLLFVIDCTGHGVPGAFVSMLVKAIERQVISKIENDKSIDISPAWILGYFNRMIKKLLKQESADSISNAGFDGGIIYYNKREKILKFSGAETPLFYIDENQDLQTIKGCRHSIGYKKSDPNYEFKEHIIDVTDGMKFYLTTDGYLDQNGGDKSFPLGKKRFSKIIQSIHTASFAKQKETFLKELYNYQKDEIRNDDITLIGIKI
jgi:serine phosphatase RsbU (regulator of sigma subunit)